MVAFCTQLMRRDHQVWSYSAEMAFVDSSGCMDRSNCRMFVLLTHSPAFYGRGVDRPKVIMTDDSRGRAISHPRSLADMHSLAVCVPCRAGCVEVAVGEAAWNRTRPSPSSTHPPEACDVCRDDGRRRAEFHSAAARRRRPPGYHAFTRKRLRGNVWWFQEEEKVDRILHQ